MRHRLPSRARRRAVAAVAAVLAALAAAAAVAAPVRQLPPGPVVVATVATRQGPVAIGLRRIRYLGRDRLCMTESNRGARGSSCARYPLGPHSGQGIGRRPVWWTTFVGACTAHHFQVISGAVLRPGLRAWLTTPAGRSQMPHAAVPKAFRLPGGIVYALVSGRANAVTLTAADGRVVYRATVAPLTHVPTVPCGKGGATAVVIGVRGAPNVIP